MTCDDIEGALADYLGGELGEADRGRFEEHLTACARCRAEVDSLRVPLDEIAALPQVDLAEAAHRSSEIVVRRRGPRGRALLIALSGAAAALLLGFVLGRRLGHEPQAHTTAQAPPPAAKQGNLHPGWHRAASRAFAGRTPPSVPPW